MNMLTKTNRLAKGRQTLIALIVLLVGLCLLIAGSSAKGNTNISSAKQVIAGAKASNARNVGNVLAVPGTGTIAPDTSTPTTPTTTPTAYSQCGPEANYTIVRSTGASIVPGLTDIGNHCDDCMILVDLPFAYTLYD